MKWFAAHIVMAVRLNDKEQTRFPIWENIVLVAAKSEREAFAKAEGIGQLEQGDDGGTFHWGGQPARWEFAGVRKLTQCALTSENPDDGAEVSFNELELDSLSAVQQFAAGNPVAVKYNDRYRAPKPAKPTERIKRVSRRPA